MDGSYSNTKERKGGAEQLEQEEGGEQHEVQKSFLTLQVYLNDGGGKDFTGGATRFITPLDPVYKEKKQRKCAESSAATETADRYDFDVCDVVPRRGRVLMFQHNIWHEGQTVVAGRKEVLRTEIMFAQRGTDP